METINKFFRKLLENASSKRFFVLVIATWFVYEGINIQTNWMILAGFFIGVDTAKNEGVFGGFAKLLTQAQLNFGKGVAATK